MTWNRKLKKKKEMIKLPVINGAVLVCPFCGSTTIVCLTIYDTKKCENK